MTNSAGNAKRRGAQVNPCNRFDKVHAEPDWEQTPSDELANPLRVLATEIIDDATKSIISVNESPDVPFRYSINPYRGCEHGCVYCYARPYHEYLGYSAGIDFETKIVVKRSAARLLGEFLSRPAWKCEPIAFSGVTDCYQPVERELRITRQCLEVLESFQQPIQLITKSTLILRDIDILSRLAANRLAHATIAVTTLDARLAHAMEPRAALPTARLDAIRQLAAAGIPTAVLIAPLIPGLTDEEMPAILEAAARAGAVNAGYVLLRLPGSVESIFFDWLDRVHPLRKSKIEAMIRATRSGRLNDPGFKTRMKGSGKIAEQLAGMFKMFRKRFGLDGPMPELDCGRFRVPGAARQLPLFDH